jgi:hypothetical protein
MMGTRTGPHRNGAFHIFGNHNVRGGVLNGGGEGIIREKGEQGVLG